MRQRRSLQSYSQMPKFDKQKKYFENLLQNGLLGHAYLFVGQDSTGKKLFTEDVCVSLTGRGFNNNPNLKFIRPDAKKDKHRIDIESIRDLKLFMSLKPYSSEYKLAVIEDAEMISDAAANAMLKILEEPPKRSVLILISSKSGMLPRTILSRCETVLFSPVPEIHTDEMDKALSELRKVVRQSIAERIKYAKQLHEKENYVELVNLWLRSIRLQVKKKPTSAYADRAAPILKNLLYLSNIISQPQYNHRIALENFFVQL